MGSPALPMSPLRHLGHGPDHGQRLARLEHLQCPVTGRALRLDRAWPRSVGHLLLEYFDDEAETTVAGQWFAEPGRLAEVAGKTAPPGATGAVATIDGAGVLLQRGGADRRLIALRPLLDDPAATLVVHRPERRAVVRVARPGATSYLKVVRPGRLAAPVSGPLVVGCARLRTPRLLSHDIARGTMAYGELAGRSLHQLLGDRAVPEAEVVSSWQATGAAVRHLHAVAPPAGTGTHDAGAEAAVVGRWVDHALGHRALAPDLVQPVKRALASVEARLAAVRPPERLSLVHRDLHDKQVLVTDSSDGGAARVGALDLDTVALGDPAVDVANLLVHLQLRVLQGHCTPGLAAAAGDAFLDGYRPGPAASRRLVAYAGATRLRLACVYAFRPRWSALAEPLLAPV